MKRRKEKVYFCKNEEEWLELALYLQQDERIHWRSTSRPMSRSGRLTIEYKKGEVEVVFVEKDGEMSHSSIDYAKRYIQQHTGVNFEIYWVKDWRRAKKMMAVSKPNLPTI